MVKKNMPIKIICPTKDITKKTIFENTLTNLKKDSPVQIIRLGENGVNSKIENNSKHMITPSDPFTITFPEVRPKISLGMGNINGHNIECVEGIFGEKFSLSGPEEAFLPQGITIQALTPKEYGKSANARNIVYAINSGSFRFMVPGDLALKQFKEMQEKYQGLNNADGSYAVHHNTSVGHVPLKILSKFCEYPTYDDDNYNLIPPYLYIMSTSRTPNSNCYENGIPDNSDTNKNYSYRNIASFSTSYLDTNGYIKFRFPTYDGQIKIIGTNKYTINWRKTLGYEEAQALLNSKDKDIRKLINTFNLDNIATGLDYIYNGKKNKIKGPYWIPDEGKKELVENILEERLKGKITEEKAVIKLIRLCNAIYAPQIKAKPTMPLPLLFKNIPSNSK